MRHGVQQKTSGARLRRGRCRVLAIKLPYPPTVNTYWRHVVIDGRARVLISEAGRRYRAAVLDRLSRLGSPKAGAGPLGVILVAHPPDRRARDLDNLPKGLLDALTHAGLWDDDSQIDLLLVRRGEVVKGGEVVVKVGPLTDGPVSAEVSP
jgi:crossover junction endodeoxyribonuclease RusA